MMNSEVFGERLKRLRERAGFSQPQLAAAAGVPVGTLRGWEQGRRIPGLDAAVQLADAIGCSLDELAGREPPEGQARESVQPSNGAVEVQKPKPGRPRKSVG
jgi:transcriptional regulator with XRE-family HTH domain